MFGIQKLQNKFQINYRKLFSGVFRITESKSEKKLISKIWDGGYKTENKKKNYIGSHSAPRIFGVQEIFDARFGFIDCKKNP